MLYDPDELADLEPGTLRPRPQSQLLPREKRERRQNRPRRKRGEQRTYNGIWRRRLHRIH